MRTLLSLAAIALAGCGSSASPGPAVEQYASEAAAIYCDFLEGCCAKAGTAFSRADCMKNKTAYYQFDVDGAKTAGATYDSTAAATCLAARKALVGQCLTEDNLLFSAGDSWQFEPSCGRLFAGTLAAGASCRSPYACALPDSGRAGCVEFSSGATCVQDRIVADGESCGDPVPVRTLCGAHSYCSAQRTCQPRSQPGGSCTGPTTCDHSICSGGKCAALATEGGSCAGPLACATGFVCAPGEICHAAPLSQIFTVVVCTAL